MKRAKIQNTITKSLKTSTPVSENIASDFHSSFKHMSVIKPNNRKKKCVSSYHEILGCNKRRKTKGSNQSYSFLQGCNDIESFKENLTAQTSSVSNVLGKSVSRKSKTALKPINDKISDISPDLWCSKRYRSSEKDSIFDFIDYDTVDSPLNKIKIQKSGNLVGTNIYERKSSTNCNRVASPFLTIRNRQEIVSARKKKTGDTVNENKIARDGCISRKKNSTLHKKKKLVESEALNGITIGTMAKRSNSSIGKKVRFSDKIDICGGLTFHDNNWNSKNAPVKESKTSSEPYSVKDLLLEFESLEFSMVKVNGKEPRAPTSEPSKRKNTCTKARRQDAESEKCSKKEHLKDGGKSYTDTRLLVKRIKLKDGGVNLIKENNVKVRKNYRSKTKKRQQLLFEEKESFDCNKQVSMSFKIRNSSELLSITENKVIKMESDKEETHLGKEDIIEVNISNEVEESEKNGPICTIKNKKYERAKKLNFVCNTDMSQTKISAVEKKEKSKLFSSESKHKEREKAENDLGLSEETTTYPSTSTPFGSPQPETSKSLLNFQCLSPILEQQSTTANGVLYDFEPSVRFTERTYGKCKLKSLSREEKMWSLLTTASSILATDTITKTFSATTSVVLPEEPEKNVEESLLFETPPQKILSEVTFEFHRQDKAESKKLKEKLPIHKKTKHRAGERMTNNKSKIIKGENSSGLNTQETELSKHFEEVLEWSLCIEKNEPKRNYWRKKRNDKKYNF